MTAAWEAELTNSGRGKLETGVPGLRDSVLELELRTAAGIPGTARTVHRP